MADPSMADPKVVPSPEASGQKVALVITPFVWDAGRDRGKPTVAYLLRGLVRAGWTVHVLSAANHDDPPRELEGAVIHHVRLPFDRTPFAYDAERSYLSLIRDRPAGLRRHLAFRLWWLRFVAVVWLRALRLSRTLRPQVVYGVNNPAIPVAWWVGRRRSIPVVARVMGTMIGAWAPALGEGLARRIRRAAGLYLLRFDELLALRLPVDRLVVTDDGSIDVPTLTGWLGVPAARIRLWRNGIDKAPFQAGADDPAARRAAARARLGLPPDAPLVLWVAQLVDWKRAERLLDALPALRTRLPEARVAIVGDGPSRAALEAQARALGVPEAVRFAGFVDRAAMADWYHAADVFVALYDHSNVSNTLLEAMLAGLPVVTLDNGTTGAVVRDGRHGRLLRADVATPALAAALHDLLADDAARARVARTVAGDTDALLDTWTARIDREVDEIEALVADRQGAGTEGRGRHRVAARKGRRR